MFPERWESSLDNLPGWLVLLGLFSEVFNQPRDRKGVVLNCVPVAVVVTVAPRFKARTGHCDLELGPQPLSTI